MQRYEDERDGKRPKLEHAPIHEAVAPPEPAHAPVVPEEPAQASIVLPEEPIPVQPDVLPSPPSPFSLMANRGLPEHFNRCILSLQLFMLQIIISAAARRHAFR